MPIRWANMTFFAGRSLRAQANRRLLIVGVFASTLLFIAGAFAYNFFIDREIAQRQAQVREYYANTLPRLEDVQHTSAVHLASRLEFSRILEATGPGRWPMLTAYLNAQWAFTAFSNMVILDANRRVLFSYGSEADTLRGMVEGESSWLYVPKYHLFYRIYRVPLWLGAEGQGELVLFRTLSNSMMRELAIPQTHLQLVYNDQVMATSDEGLEAVLNDPKQYRRMEIPWSKDKQGKQPVLVAYRDIQDIFPFSQFVMRPVMVSIVIIALFWFGLGRWLNLTTKRIESLGLGARHYAEGHERAAVGTLLMPAYSREDEIRVTAQAFEGLMQTIEERDQEQQSYMDTLALLEEAVIEFDADGRILRASPGWKKLSRQTDSLGRNLNAFIHEDDVETLQSEAAQLFNGDKRLATLRMRLQGNTEENLELWVEARLLAFKNVQGKVDSVRGVLRDITQTYLHEQQITRMALHDALTDLPNRLLLEDRFKVALRLATRHKDKVGICFIDIDHFKVINDTLGHKAGDRLLVEFSRRLSEQLRAGDTLARWGGDEFVLLLPEMDDENGIRQVAEKVTASLQQPLELDGNETRVTFSMGAAVYPIDGQDMETLFSHADRAMFHAKAQGRNQTCFFRDITSKGVSKKELHIQNRLAAAIDQHLIQTWFQPIVDAATGRCTSVEVLARWRDDEHGWISPAMFIPMAENQGLIHDLGSQILLSSLDAMVHLLAQGLDILLAVNISKRQLFIRSFPEWLLEEVARRGLKPGQIVLEVTESVALNDVDRGIDRIQELRQAGFHIAIDDFGTGYSSLSQLHEMSAAELKIDISFVRRLHEPAGKSMVQAIVSMAHALGMKTVAEGVETQESADILNSIGVSCLQGYLFGKPMPLEQFEAWLEENVRSSEAASLQLVSGMTH
jgi:diguanylate cyclase (GGDEF)-like protein/PAS domain S-box-containing protein